MTYYKKIYKSPLGDLSLVADESGLVGTWFLGQKYFERGLTEVSILGNHPFLDLASDFLDAYFSGQQPDQLPSPCLPKERTFSSEFGLIFRPSPMVKR